MFLRCKYSPEFILLVFIVTFSLFKHPGNSWDRVINSDGKGYYAYLPALIIYHDLDYSFIEHYESTYYPPGKSMFKEFRTHVDGWIVNKCFPGLALLWLPFFLLAHILSLVLGFPADGYSILYQYAIAAAALFYLWLGCRFLMKLLTGEGVSSCLAAWITLLTALGTNLIFFTVIEGSMSHVYSFAVITVFLYCIQRLFRSGNPSWFPAGSFLFALLAIIRPANMMILLAVPFLAGGWKEFGDTVRKILRSPPVLSLGIVAILLIGSIPPLLWHISTGHWLVNPYGQETFHFRDPHFFGILFSYNRGWFIYTPVAFVSFFGFIGLYRASRWKFSWLLAFFLVFIYTASCWWMWYYASKSGQRIFIDFYALTALLMASLFALVARRQLLKRLLNMLLGLLLILNLFQFYQHAKFIFPAACITKQIYWDSFFSLFPKARIDLPEGAVAGSREISLGMEPGTSCLNTSTFTSARAFNGRFSSMADANQPCSAGIMASPDTLFTTSNRAIRVSAMVFRDDARTPVILVFDFARPDSCWCYYPVYLDSYVRTGRWTPVETVVYVPEGIPPPSSVKIYFYNPGEKPLFVNDIKIFFLSLKEEPAYRRIEEVLVPCKK